ncbi:MAG: beta-ketoacyl-ACP synthase III [Bacteroidales bacterium]
MSENKYNAVITGVGGYVPEYVMTNQELAQKVETSDEWINTRIGIKERRILKEENEGTSFMGARAVNELLEKTNTDPRDIDMLICGIVTPDMQFPATANIICDKSGIKNAFGFDLNAGCSSFLYALVTGSKYIESGTHKKVVIVGADKMSSITDYTDRATCPIFGDGAGAVLLEPTEEKDMGLIDATMQVDGSGRKHLHQVAGGSQKPASFHTVLNREHFIYQEGQQVFKAAVSKMADVSVEVMKKHNIAADELDWFVPHQANMRIIEATAKRMGISKDIVMINIHKYGNTTSATIPLLLLEWENKMKKGDKLIIATFGAGFAWGSAYLRWGYDGR